jgi:hypothetical protein
MTDHIFHLLGKNKFCKVKGKSVTLISGDSSYPTDVVELTEKETEKLQLILEKLK